MTTPDDDTHPPSSAPAPARHILTVSELTERVRDTLEGTFGTVWLSGEISGLRTPPSGHVYLTLKDAGAQLKTVIWGSTARYLRQMPKDGDQVLCRGRITVYAARGDYQFVIDYLEPAGVGALFRQFEQVQARLAAEGLFSPDRKRPMPTFPRRIAVVTSASGAAIRDVLTVLERRAPGLDVLVVPTPVQGADAPRRIAEALAAAGDAGREGEWGRELDAIILTRGGGSMEDLAAFNDEGLARVIAASPLPVMCGVGHETDVTIADLVADMRAPTPSAAAELITVPWAEGRARTRELVARLVQSGRSTVRHGRLRVEKSVVGLVDPRTRMNHMMQRIDDLGEQVRHLAGRRIDTAKSRLRAADLGLLAHSPGRTISPLLTRTRTVGGQLETVARRRIAVDRARLETVIGKLNELSPMAVLGRGFAVARAKGKVLRRATDVVPGDGINLRLMSGEVDCRVEAVHPPVRQQPG